MTSISFRGFSDERVTPSWTPAAVESGRRPPGPRQPSMRGWILEAWGRRRFRVCLSQLGGRLLRDTHAGADREANKPRGLGAAGDEQRLLGITLLAASATSPLAGHRTIDQFLADIAQLTRVFEFGPGCIYLENAR